MSTPVIDPFGVAADPKMPFLAGALNPLRMQRQFERCRPCLTGDQGQARPTTRDCATLNLRAIRVTRYKPGRRCMIEYDLAVERPGAPAEEITLVGKVQARGMDYATYHLLESLWNAGFVADSNDGIAVPRPIGVIPELQMWLQHKVPGEAATQLLTEPGGVALARRIAEAVHKLHRTGIPPCRRHAMADELRILHERLSIVAQMKPQWAKPLERLLDACDQLGAATPAPRPCGIHRDFYPDQVIVDGARLYLLDFDLYCEGDPGLDIGNFLGHLTEQSVRTLGDAYALADREEAMEERFVALSGEATRPAVRAYTTLTLVRHIYLSTQFPERRQYTEVLLELCEQRLGTAERAKSANRYAWVAPH